VTDARIDSSYAWMRLGLMLLLGTIGTAAMWIASVAVPQIQAEFGATRAAAALPYTATTLGFAVGAVMVGHLSDRFGVIAPIVIGAVSLAIGFTLGSYAQSLWQLAAVQFLFIGMFGSSAFFGPLIAEISMWFQRRRGIAVAICASGNYVSGAVWPPITQSLFDTIGWRQTYLTIAVVTLLTILPLTLLLRARQTPAPSEAEAAINARASDRPLGFPPNTLQGLLALAALSCCVAMAMPQVHIVAYCVDLGYGAARGAEMLALMLACGVISRIGMGMMSDRIGALRTLLIGSGLQGVSLVLFLPFDGIVSLYLISALFGLVQGGIVPAYAVLVREYFSPREAGVRVGIVMTASLLGMALGGWMTGAVFDLTGSYRAAFVNGIAWNVLNLAIAFWLLRRGSMRPALA
jgi:MFS family permease